MCQDTSLQIEMLWRLLVYFTPCDIVHEKLGERKVTLRTQQSVRATLKITLWWGGACTYPVLRRVTEFVGGRSVLESRCKGQTIEV